MVGIRGAEIAVAIKLEVFSIARALDAQFAPCVSDGAGWGTNCLG